MGDTTGAMGEALREPHPAPVLVHVLCAFFAVRSTVLSTLFNFPCNGAPPTCSVLLGGTPEALVKHPPYGDHVRPGWAGTADFSK